jgi:hypothetical protein
MIKTVLLIVSVVLCQSCMKTDAYYTITVNNKVTGSPEPGVTIWVDEQKQVSDINGSAVFYFGNHDGRVIMLRKEGFKPRDRMIDTEGGVEPMSGVSVEQMVDEHRFFDKTVFYTIVDALDTLL